MTGGQEGRKLEGEVGDELQAVQEFAEEEGFCGAVRAGDDGPGGDCGVGGIDEAAGPEEQLPAGASQEMLFRDLVRRHQRRLYAFVLKNVGNPSDAEELAQQAFVEAAASLRTFRGESELSSWLYGIAMNLVRNYLSRSPHRRYTIEDESALEMHVAPGAGPLERLETSRLVSRLQEELEGLPAEMRDVLLLVALEDLSYEEAAVYLAIPIGTVRSRVSRARDVLRRKLGDSYGDRI